MVATALISLRQSIVCQINQNISTARSVVRPLTLFLPSGGMTLEKPDK